MMIRALTVSLLLAALATPAFAQDAPAPQDNPQTRQTDQSEDDYRRSQRRRDTGDIFEDIDINTRSDGAGGILGREVKAIDRLNAESRRHLIRQRGKAMAEAEVGEPIDAAYEPSEEAKTDEYVAQQEREAWAEMMEEANRGLGAGGTGQGTGQEQGGSDQAVQGQSGQGQSGQGQVGQGQAGNGQDSANTSRSPSPLRGGSTSSASAILDQIKGRGTANTSGGQAGNGQADGNAQAQAPSQGEGQGQSPSQSNAQTGAQGQAEDAQGQSEADAQAQAQAEADADAKAQQAAQAAAQGAAAAEANASAGPAASTAAQRETESFSPLDRLKRDPVERESGDRTSASDYLKKRD